MAFPPFPDVLDRHLGERRRLTVANAMRNAAHGQITAAADAMNAALVETHSAGDWSLIATHLALSKVLTERAKTAPLKP